MRGRVGPEDVVFSLICFFIHQLIQYTGGVLFLVSEELGAYLWKPITHVRFSKEGDGALDSHMSLDDSSNTLQIKKRLRRVRNHH